MTVTTLPIAGQEWNRLKGQPGYDLVQNPPFDSRILNLPMRQVSQQVDANGKPVKGGFKDSTLYRGAIISKETPVKGAPKVKVNFLYNPSTINESRSLDMNNPVLPDYQRVPGDTSNYIGPLNTSVGFSLLFDRTYELWDSKYQGTDVGTFGVQVDTNAFYALLGINQKQNVKGVRGAKSYNLVVQGPMLFSPCDLYFGYGSPGGLHYYGYVSSLNITYTHFSQQMVPMRCAMDIGFTVYPTNTTE